MNTHISAKLGTIIIIILTITIGVFVWKYIKDSKQSLTQPQNVAISQKTTSENKGQKIPTDRVSALDNVKISNFENWKTYANDAISIELKYPPELYLSASKEKITFDYLSPDNPEQEKEYSAMYHFDISLEHKTIKQYIKEYQLNTAQNFKQGKIQLGNITTEQVTYVDAFSGGTIYITFIQKGLDTIIIDYSGNNKLEDTFNKMLKTIEILK